VFHVLQHSATVKEPNITSTKDKGMWALRDDIPILRNVGFVTLCFITRLPSFYRVNTYLTIFWGSKVCLYWCTEDKTYSHRRHGIKLCRRFNCKFNFMRGLFRYPHFLTWTACCMIEYIPLYIFWLSQHQSAVFHSALPTVPNLHSAVSTFLRENGPVVLKLKVLFTPIMSG